MKIVSVKINNYKSLGDSNNKLLLDDNVTTIIGKNESGKSNILEGISKIKFLENMNNDFFKDINRMIRGDISIEVIMKFTTKEKETMEIMNDEKTTFAINFYNEVVFSGGLENIIKSNNILISVINELKEYIKTKEGNLDYNTRNLTNETYKRLDNIGDRIFLGHEYYLNNLEAWLNSGTSEEKIDIKEIVQKTIQIINEYYEMIPEFYYRYKDEQLKTLYSIDDIKKCISNKNDSLYRFFIASKVEPIDYINAFENQNSAEREDVRDYIRDHVKVNIEEKFQEYYTQEKIKIRLQFDSNCLRFLIQTDNKNMCLDERSNGLRWYLSLFIDTLSQNIKNRPIIYLLDEPGVYLHVNAQRELINHFCNLCKNNNQVIYTTHSPYMIDNDNVLNIRAVEKDNNGITQVYNKIHDQKLSKYSKEETLSPLVQAIGADLKYNIGPSIHKLNIITEGMTDYIYMSAMMNCLGIKEDVRPNIIPSISASNIHNIVSILFGWGCDFKVVLDYDREGYNEYKKLSDKFGLKLNDNMFFINCEEINEEKIKNYPVAIENLINEEDKLKFSNHDFTENKVLSANEFYYKVSTKDNITELSEITRNNFEKLFNELGILK